MSYEFNLHASLYHKMICLKIYSALEYILTRFLKKDHVYQLLKSFPECISMHLDAPREIGLA
jgi:hypothetical protein